MATYITADELRAHLGEAAAATPAAVLDDYIDALEAEIDTRFGTLLPTTVRLTPSPRSDLLVLPRRARALTSVVELDSGPVVGQTTTTLDATDYAIRSPFLLERLGTGTNPRRYWSRYGVDVTFLPLDDSAARKLAIVDIAKLEASHSGLESVRIGDYAESSGAGGADASALEGGRARILRRLRHRKLVLA